MKIPLDIHTHRLPLQAGSAVVNCNPNTFVPGSEGYFSVGIHPWQLDSSPELAVQCEEKGFQFPDLIVCVRASEVLAVGEAGLDRFTKCPMKWQMKLFDYQARIAEEVDKPLLIHLVRAVDELLEVKRELRPTKPWIIHGFRGNMALAETLLRHGFYLSFGERYQAEVVRQIPIDRLFLETDESEVPIEQLYERVARLRSLSVEEFKRAVQENICRLFFKS